MRDFANIHPGPMPEPAALRSQRRHQPVGTNPNVDLAPDQRLIRDRCLHPSGSFIEFPVADVNATVAQRFEKIARLYPGHVAIEMDGQSVTYGELDAMANRLAEKIPARACNGDAPIGLLFDKGIEQCAAMLAVLKAGRFFVTLEPKLPKSRLQLTAADCHPSLIISKGEHRELAEELVGERQRVLTFDTVFGPDAVVQRERRISPDDYACIMFTSGSTGRPKGILWSQRSLLHHVMLRTNADGLCCADRIAHLSSGTSNATTNVFLALLNGATLLAYDTERGTMNELWDWLAREQVTVCMIAAPLFRSLCAAPEKRGSLDRLRIIRLRSDTALVGDVVLFKANFSSPCVLANGLASSETGMLSEYYIGHDSVLEDDNVPVGFAAPDKELLVVDDGGRPLDRGAVGELVVRSRFLSPGYWRDPELTQAKFKTDPDDPQMRLYHTGDLALFRAGGCLVHRGRKDFRVKIRGYGVDTVEVEKALCAHPDVREAAVVARPDDVGETRLIAYLTSRSPGGPSVTELRLWMGELLADYMIPTAYVRLDKIPLTANGKIDRKALPEPNKTRPKLNVACADPRDDLERELRRIWIKVLSLDAIGIHDNFFDLGGQSLAAMRMLSEVEHSLGKKMSVAVLLKSPTVAELACALRDHGDLAPQPLIAVQPNGSKPPFFCVHGTDSYARLARYLGSDQPFFGLAQHLEGRKINHIRIEDIAVYYIDAVKTVQAQGPYYLGGHSIGGLIAFEMAQQLRNQGEEIRLLAILDSGAPRKSRATPAPTGPGVETNEQIYGRQLAWIKKHASTIGTGAKEKLINHAKSIVCELYHRSSRPLPPSLQTFYVDRVVYGEIYPRAHWDYLPRRYSGRALYFKSEDTRERVEEWKKLMTAGMQILTVPGDHLSMLVEPHVSRLAEALKQCLLEAQVGTRSQIESGE